MPNLTCLLLRCTSEVGGSSGQMWKFPSKTEEELYSNDRHAFKTRLSLYKPKTESEHPSWKWKVLVGIFIRYVFLLISRFPFLQCVFSKPIVVSWMFDRTRKGLKTICFAIWRWRTGEPVSGSMLLFCFFKHAVCLSVHCTFFEVKSNTHPMSHQEFGNGNPKTLNCRRYLSEMVLHSPMFREIPPYQAVSQRKKCLNVWMPWGTLRPTGLTDWMRFTSQSRGFFSLT